MNMISCVSSTTRRTGRLHGSAAIARDALHPTLIASRQYFEAVIFALTVGLAEMPAMSAYADDAKVDVVAAAEAAAAVEQANAESALRRAQVATARVALLRNATALAKAAEVAANEAAAAQEVANKAMAAATAPSSGDLVAAAASNDKKTSQNNLNAQRTLPNDRHNYQADRVTFHSDIVATLVNDKADGTPTDTPTRLCVRAHSDLVGSVSTLDGVRFRSEPGNPLMSSKLFGPFGPARVACKDPQNKTCKTYCDSCDRSQCPGAVDYDLPSGTVVEVSQKTLDANPSSRYGLTYGGLVVPFKYQHQRQRDIRSSAAAAPYFGYRFDENGTLGFALDVIGFAGLSSVDISREKDGKTETSNAAAISYGGGGIVTIKSLFQLGVVVGWDRVKAGQGFQYNKKPWVAFAIGHSFLE